VCSNSKKFQPTIIAPVSQLCRGHGVAALAGDAKTTVAGHSLQGKTGGDVIEALLDPADQFILFAFGVLEIAVGELGSFLFANVMCRLSSVVLPRLITVVILFLALI
jgi:hypothetical protein